MVRTGGTEQYGVSPREDFLIAERPGYLLHKAGLVLVEDVEKALGAVGMRIRYFFVLAALAGGPELSQQDLSRLLNLDPTTMVALVDEMEGAGHVERRRNPSDRRRYILSLTDGGRKALERAGHAVDEVERDFLAAVPEADRERLRTLLGELLADRWPRVIAC